MTRVDIPLNQISKAKQMYKSITHENCPKSKYELT